MGKTIIVSNRLPVKISKDEKNRYQLNMSEGGLATGLGSIYKQKNNIWIGWCGMEVNDEADKQKIVKKLDEENLSPVFLTEREIQLYYEGFSNETLWPICHYMSTYAQYEQEYWDEYKTVNEKFRDAILAVAEPGDIIWIHDYQLLLLPQLVREKLPDSTIGFFQHIPFPSYEIFRLIPWRAELVEGMLGSDLIGFHTYDDVRHFTSSATRILPVQGTANVIMSNDRNITVDAFPMGIDYKKFEKLTHASKVQRNVDELNDVTEDTKIILSIDRLDYSKGIIQRLMAFDKVLADNPEYIEKVSMEMIVVPSRDQIPRYKELKDEIDKWVGNINAHYRTARWHPIHYFYRSFPIENLSALYVKSDVCLVTPMRDGMNLVSKEFIASRRDDDGVLILSEMAGASKELTEALIVNPNNLGEMYRAIIQALEMPLEEQQTRMRSLKAVVKKFDINHWVKIFMDKLHEVKLQEVSRQTKHVGETLTKVFVDKKAEADSSLFFLDYDGTLTGFSSDINKVSPDEELLSILNNLDKKKNTSIVIISGRDHETLEKWFGHLPFDMIAEHGAWVKSQQTGWTSLAGLSDKWKKKVRLMLEVYSDRTPGSFIEEKKYSLVWHYRKVEAGLGEMRANELISNLRYLLRGKRLQVMPGNKVVEIKNSDINKGKAALAYLYHHKSDFVIAFGDDHTDEDIFTALPDNAYTVKVGGSKSAAKYYLRNVDEVRGLLKKLS